jgi:hypothetical protein
MKVRNLALLIVSALLLSSCSDPYFSTRGESQLMIEKDIRFLEAYKNTFCSIMEMYERKEISRGKCIALYYDGKENDSDKAEVAKRVSYILKNPDKFDKNISDRLSNITTKTVECTTYINQNCR